MTGKICQLKGNDLDPKEYLEEGIASVVGVGIFFRRYDFHLQLCDDVRRATIHGFRSAQGPLIG